MLGDLFYQLGTVIGGLDSHLPGKHGAEDFVEPEPDAAADPDDHDIDPAGGLLAGAAGAWLVARVLRPRPVRWPRVVLAGVAATVIADVVARTLDPRPGPEPRRPLFEGDPETIVRRFGAGVAVAAGYASLLYPRLPGPPMLRGLAFGALEVAAAPRGGLVRLAGEAPGLRFPLQRLALPLDEDELATPISRLAFGLGLGLFYHDSHEDYDDED